MEEKFGISTKKYMLEELIKRFDSSSDFVITNYKGLASKDIEKLRKEMRKASSEYFVVKNSMAKRAFTQLELKGLEESLKGEVGIGFTNNVIGTSKTLVDFAKGHASFKINCAFIDGKLENLDRVKQLAALPPKDVLLGLACFYMQSPIKGFVGVLKNLLSGLACAVNEIKKKREGGEKNG